MSLSRIVKILAVLVVIAIVWKVVISDSSEVDVEYDPAE